jgi:hypothetical protein
MPAEVMAQILEWRRRHPGWGPRGLVHGSADVETGGYEGWSFEDVEEARDDTMAAWHYVDQATFKCRKCRHEWKTGRRA